MVNFQDWRRHHSPFGVTTNVDQGLSTNKKFQPKNLTNQKTAGTKCFSLVARAISNSMGCIVWAILQSTYIIVSHRSLPFLSFSFGHSPLYDTTNTILLYYYTILYYTAGSPIEEHPVTSQAETSAVNYTLFLSVVGIHDFLCGGTCRFDRS